MEDDTTPGPLPERDFPAALPGDTAVTFDDVLLTPQASSVEPDAATVTTTLAGLDLSVPVLSAAMDTVTGPEMAAAMATHGGLGVLHQNLTADELIAAIKHVKRSDDLMIPADDVVTVHPDQTLADADRVLSTNAVNGAPVVADDNTVCGILSRTDLRPAYTVPASDQPAAEVAPTDAEAPAADGVDPDAMTVADAMTEDVITVTADVTPREAVDVMYTHKVERVPVVDDDMQLRGLLTMRDLLATTADTPAAEHATRDADGQLAVAVAVGPFDHDRAERAVAAGADAVVVDCAHAHNQAVLDSAATLAETLPEDVVLIVGNIATAAAAEDLVDVADVLKVGVGPGSICTTRVVSGAGMPQLTAVAEVAAVAHAHDVPVIADGGIRYSGDAVKALAAGADAVMVGSYLAGTDEAPGRVVTIDGQQYTEYRGMGSVGAMQDGSSDRYLKDESATDATGANEVVPEGVEAATPYVGSVADQLAQLAGGVRSGMGYVGAATIPELQQRATFVQVSPAGLQEGHPHDIQITDEAPNYRPDDA